MRQRPERKRTVDLAILAREAASLLNEAIGHLLVPQHLFELFTKLQESGRAPERYSSMVRRTAMMAAIVGISRLHEVREEMLVPWLYADAELQALGFEPVSQFVPHWKDFLIVRSQYVAHATGRRAQRGAPGRLLPPETFGRALRRTGLYQADEFLVRVREQLVPQVERVRDALFVRFPEARAFVEGGYGQAIEKAAEPDEPGVAEHRSEEGR